MAQKTAQDANLIRGSVDLTINGVVYSCVDFKGGAKGVTEKDKTTLGKYLGSSTVEDAEEYTCTIRARGNQVAPPKFKNFAFNPPNGTSTATNWYIIERELSGTQGGIQSYAVTVIENPSGVDPVLS